MTTPPAPAPKRPALDPATVTARTGTLYPAQYKPVVAGREKRALGDALGLTNFGVNLVRLPPGAASALRHWHSKQDEFVYVLEGEATLVTEAGAQVLGAGQCAGFVAGAADGHHLVNRSAADVVYLEIGDRSAGDVTTYPDPDVDLAARLTQTYAATKKDGTPL